MLDNMRRSIEDFIDLSFKYLVFNGLIQNDNPEVVKFLENIKEYLNGV